MSTKDRIILFFFAGGFSLFRPAFAQAKEDFTLIKGGVTEQVKNIRNKTNAGANGETVG